jgi:hypothetical protein
MIMDELSNMRQGAVSAAMGIMDEETKKKIEEDRELQAAIQQYNALQAELRRRREAAFTPAKGAESKRKAKQKAQKAARKRNR